MVNERYSKAMAETLHYLKGIRQDDIKKIPNSFMQFLKENALENYECNFDYTKPLKDLELMDETRGLISMICLNYWCENEEQKNNFIKHLNENEIRYQEELSKKYNVDETFKKKEITSDIETVIEEKDTKILPVQLKKQNILRKIQNIIANFFNKKLNFRK